MKTLADLKRDAKSGQYEVRMVIRMGATDIPERLSGWRKMVGSNSVAVFMQTNDGRKSELNIPRASLVEYEGETLTIYSAGYRDLTDAEKAVISRWEERANSARFREQAVADVYSDGSSTYWEKVAFFTEAKMTHLLGYDKVNGMRLDKAKMQVLDERVKGEVEMRYEVRKA